MMQDLNNCTKINIAVQHCFRYCMVLKMRHIFFAQITQNKVTVGRSKLMIMTRNIFNDLIQQGGACSYNKLLWPMLVQIFCSKSFFLDVVVLSLNSLIISKRANLKTVVSRKQSTPNFPKNEHFLPPDTHTYVCVSGGKKCSFFGKFGVLCFLETPVLRFVLLSYYR